MVLISDVLNVTAGLPSITHVRMMTTHSMISGLLAQIPGAGIIVF